MSQNASVWCRGRGSYYRYGSDKVVGAKDTAGTTMNTGKSETIKKLVSHAVPLSLHPNFGWGNSNAPVNLNPHKLPVLLNSTSLDSHKLPEVHSLEGKKEVSKVGIKFEASSSEEKKNMIGEVSVPAEVMKQQPKKDGVGAAGNIGKPELTKKDVNRMLDLNPGWGDFDVPVDVNGNRAPVVVNSSRLVSKKTAETHPVQKKTEVFSAGVKLEEISNEKKNVIDEVSLPAEVMKQPPKKDGVGAAGNMGKPELTKKDVNRMLDLNPDWGDFDVPMDVNCNRVPVIVNSSLVSHEPAETHPLQKKKEVLNAGNKLEKISNEKKNVIDKVSPPGEVMKQQTKKDGVQAVGSVARSEPIHDSVMISRADLVKFVAIADQFLDDAESLRRVLPLLRSLSGGA